jgi:hypothetical protein
MLFLPANICASFASLLLGLYLVNILNGINCRVDSALGYLHRVDLHSVTEVSKVHAASIFKV